jgi:hypothetical protein
MIRVFSIPLSEHDRAERQTRQDPGGRRLVVEREQGDDAQDRPNTERH